MSHEEPYSHQAYSDDELAAARELHDLVMRIPDFIRVADRASNITPLRHSALAADDAATTPNQSSHYLSLLFQHAADFLRAVEKLCDPQEAAITIPLVALNPLMRAVLEDSAIAMWLLQPDDSKGRVQRLLTITDDELGYEVRATADYVDRSRGSGHHEKGVLEGLRREAARMQKRKRAEMRAVAVAVDLADEHYIGKMPDWLTLIDSTKPGTAWENSALLTATWSALSGMSHFSHSRAMTLLDREVVGDGSAEGVKLARTTANLRTTVTFLLTCMGLFAAASERLRERKLPAAEA
jgi:hypothetical protein